jgi:hypothetical protein
MKVSEEEARRRVAESKGARERWLCALHLLAHQELIPKHIRDGNWDALRSLRDFRMPDRLEEHDPALHDLLTREWAQLQRCGLCARLLRALARGNGDALAAALLRGLAVRLKLVESDGGSCSLAQAAQRLRLPEEAILKHVKASRLVVWRDWREESLPYRFPGWQFEGSGLLPGIVKVLQVFRSADQWRVMLYFLSKRLSLGRKRPLDLLRAGEVGKVLQHARWTHEDGTW